MVWAALFFTPYFLAGGQVELSPVAMNTWVPLGLYAVIFYLNYFSNERRMSIRPKIL